eukprot:8615696-Pyramimonas_sp.AAC.2
MELPCGEDTMSTPSILRVSESMVPRIKAPGVRPSLKGVVKRSVRMVLTAGDISSIMDSCKVASFNSSCEVINASTRYDVNR